VSLKEALICLVDERGLLQSAWTDVDGGGGRHGDWPAGQWSSHPYLTNRCCIQQMPMFVSGGPRVCIDPDLLFERSSTCHTRANSMKLNKCHIVSARDSHCMKFTFGLLSHRQLSHVSNGDFGRLTSAGGGVFIVFLHTYRAYVSAWLSLPLYPVDTYVLLAYVGYLGFITFCNTFAVLCHK